jgi:hypothetical protein
MLKQFELLFQNIIVSLAQTNLASPNHHHYLTNAHILLGWPLDCGKFGPKDCSKSRPKLSTFIGHSIVESLVRKDCSSKSRPELSTFIGHLIAESLGQRFSRVSAQTFHIQVAIPCGKFGPKDSSKSRPKLSTFVGHSLDCGKFGLEELSLSLSLSLSFSLCLFLCMASVGRY